MVLAFTDALGPVRVAFTDRAGGVSPAPYDALSLSAPASPPPALAAHDWAADIATNLARVAEALAAHAPDHHPPMMGLMHQVHGCDVVDLDEWTSQSPPAADAVVTRRTDLALVSRVADCVPVLLADPDAGIVGAAHAGRAGLVSGVLPAVVGALRDRGAARLTAWVGPHICGRCYEVPEAMRAEVAAQHPRAHSETSWGTPALDLGAAATAQLEVLQVEVVDAARCTRESPDLYSHRRDGSRSGRFAGVVWLTEPPR